MALKDLVAPKAALTEEAIESLISNYVRYDVDEKEIAFTPAANALSNKSKVLVYLAALQGWPFVSDDAISTTSKPAEMEQRIGIPGGSLRPILKDLKDRHLANVKDGSYFIRSSSIAAIHSEISSESTSDSPTRRRKRQSPPKKVSSAEGDATSAAKLSDPPIKGRSTGSRGKSDSLSRRATAKNGGAAASFEAWISDGFFSENRTLSDVQNRFHKEAIIIPRTSIPALLLRAVRTKRLKREKMDVSGKSVWVYTQG
jgi:hypothetical protein